jgi:TetR/AcrR family transcriptional regulator, cholesterol catabolism regulator
MTKHLVTEQLLSTSNSNMRKMKLQGIRTRSENEDLVIWQRELIVKKTVHLFATKGLQKTSVRDIANACNMTSGNLYNYIGKKEDLVTLVIQNNYSHLFKFIHEMNDFSDLARPEESLAKAVDRFIRIHHEYRDIIYFVHKDYTILKPSLRLMISETTENVAGVFEKIINIGCRDGSFSVQNPWLAAHSIRAVGQLWTLQYRLLSRRFTVDDYIAAQLEQIFNMLNCHTRVRT